MTARGVEINKLKIRAALPNDFDEVAVILFDIAEMHHTGDPQTFKKPTLKNPVVKDDFLAALDDEKRMYFVAVLEGRIVGLVSASIKERRKSEYVVPGKFGHINELGIKKSFRNLGIGSALVYKTLEWIKSFKNIEEVTLNVRSFNKEAIDFYKNLGFEPISYRMRRMISHE